MIRAEVLDALVAAGATPEMIVAAVKADQQRASGASRQAAYRARKASLVTSRDVTDVTVTPCDDAGNCPSPPSPNGFPININNPSLTPSAPTQINLARDVADAKPTEPSVREILETCLLPQTVKDLIAHRKAKKAPMTPVAAKLLVKAFRDFGDPELAVRSMILRHWTGFDPKWMTNNDARAGPGCRRMTMAEISRLDPNGQNDDPEPNHHHGKPTSDQPDQSGPGFAGAISERDSPQGQGRLLDLRATSSDRQ